MPRAEHSRAYPHTAGAGAGACPVPRSVCSEQDTPLPSAPNSPLPPCSVTLSCPPCFVLPHLRASGQVQLLEWAHQCPIPQLELGAHYSDESHR